MGGFLFLCAVVVVSGGAIMILELLGTRVIAPFYGTSLYVWSALITVTLIALAGGYYLGGYCADRVERLRLSHLTLIAGVATAGIPFISQPALSLTEPLGLQAGAFVSAAMLFGLPLLMLAMVGPYVIKIATRDLKSVGKITGSVYAVSTLGSVVGTMLLVFYLLPAFGTRTILFGLSVILVLLSFVLVVWDRVVVRRPMSASHWGLVLGTAALMGHGFSQPFDKVTGFKVLHSKESVYGWVRVVDDTRNGYRLLLSDASVLSAIQLGGGQTLLVYQTVLENLPLLRPHAKRALVIGLGGGYVARVLRAKGIVTDTIEIDPMVAQAALDYFGFKPTGRFIVGDARYEVRKLKPGYDLIIHDCFTGGSEPVHLLTVEMLIQLRELLSKDGILALNYVGFIRGEGVEAARSVYRTLRSVLPHLRVFVTGKEDFTDFIFLASQQPLQLTDKQPGDWVRWLSDHEYIFNELKGGVVVRDDFNPIETMQLRKAERYRNLFVGRVVPNLLHVL